MPQQIQSGFWCEDNQEDSLSDAVSICLWQRRLPFYSHEMQCWNWKVFSSFVAVTY